VFLHIETQGQGFPLVLAHGFGGSSRNFFPQARSLRSSYQVWMYDARGHARSGAPENVEAHGWPCLVADFDKVVACPAVNAADTASKRVLAGGLSLGAATALFWALQNQDRVRGLVLAAYPECTSEMRSWAADFANCIESNGIDSAGRQFVWGGEGRFQATDARLVRQGFLEHSPPSLAAILRFALAEIPDISALSDELGGFCVPTLVVVGAEDARSQGASRTLVEAIPNARLAVIENAGHVVNLSQWADFNRHLAEFARHCE
jgi:pimeloyl-ACP methyl ester carboxylesterase